MPNSLPLALVCQISTNPVEDDTFTMGTVPFSEFFKTSHPLGDLAAVHLPDGVDPVPEEVLSRLWPEERDHARGLRGRRQIEWVGGRLALHLAAGIGGRVLPPVLPGNRGQPLLPEGVSGSISHKRRVALALVGKGVGTIGIDAEELAPPRMAILPRVLRAEERLEVESLPEGERWFALVTRFAIKEAIYKAIHPHVERYVRFEEARVGPVVGGRASVALDLHGGEGPFEVDARVETAGELLIALVRIHAAHRGG